jgi:hypothetical protein
MIKAQRRNDVPPDYEVERAKGYVTERFRSVGELHRDEGPAVVQRHVASDCVVYEAYYQHGVRHRDGGKPAELAFDLDTGLCRSSNKMGERRAGNRILQESRRRPLSDSDLSGRSKGDCVHVTRLQSRLHASQHQAFLPRVAKRCNNVVTDA